MLLVIPKGLKTPTTGGKTTTIRDALKMVEESGAKLDYELGQKLCLNHKVFVYFNWNCREHNTWKT